MFGYRQMLFQHGFIRENRIFGSYGGEILWWPFPNAMEN